MKKIFQQHGVKREKRKMRSTQLISFNDTDNSDNEGDNFNDVQQ